MIKVCIKGQKIENFSSPPIVADTVDYITAAFHFLSSDWEGLTKYAHFSNGKENYDIELTNDVISADKHLNFTAGEWTLWVHGSVIEDGELKQRITTDEITFYVKSTGTTETGDPFPSAVPSITEQLMAEIGNLDKLETSDKQTLVDAINEAFHTAGGEISPEMIAEAVERYFEKHPIGEETDPTVPEWAKRPEKPTYSAEEVGALPDTTKIPSLEGYATEQFVREAVENIDLPEDGYTPQKGIDYFTDEEIAQVARMAADSIELDVEIPEFSSEVIPLTWTTGAYISESGAVETNSAWSYTKK